MRAIGRYAILGLLGRGGMGAVYKAAMPRVGRAVALKVLAPSEDMAAAADARALRQGFLREAALMARIRHPGVAQVLDVDEDAAGRPFFVMEYYCDNLGALLGESYRVERPTRRLSVERSLSLARQLASALARLHYEGILHRDVKPYNMMLADAPELFGPDGGGDELKLIDFGLSRLRGEAEPGRARGAVVGSPYYAAPEQETDPDLADERADVFSAGVTLFRCLTGRLPQEGIPASALRQGLDAFFDDFFVRCCADDPAARPASAKLLLAELTDLVARWERLRASACALPPEDGPDDAPSALSAWPSPAMLSGRPDDAPSGQPDGQPDDQPPSRIADTPSGLSADHPAAQHGSVRLRPVRSRPVRQPLRGACAFFGLDDLWRPAANTAERFRLVDGEPRVVRDELTGLLWERGGSAYSTSIAGAREHARALCANRFGGRGGWRLPTVDELCTLLTPEPDLRSLCLPAVFDPAQRRLWSADAKSHVAAWYADAEHGFIWWRDTDCELFARCVTLGK